MDDHRHGGRLLAAGHAVDRNSGASDSRHREIFHRDKPIEKHATNSYASPTPILEGDRVYVHFGTMGTACLDAATAEPVWKSEAFQLEHEVGPGSSPTLFEDLLLFNCDGTDVQFGAALNKNTGEAGMEDRIARA